MLINIKYVGNELNYFCPKKWEGKINLQTFQTQNIIPIVDFFSEDAFEKKTVSQTE